MAVLIDKKELLPNLTSLSKKELMILCIYFAKWIYPLDDGAWDALAIVYDDIQNIRKKDRKKILKVAKNLSKWQDLLS